MQHFTLTFGKFVNKKKSFETQLQIDNSSLRPDLEKRICKVNIMTGAHPFI